jgi:hypothetical protein
VRAAVEECAGGGEPPRHVRVLAEGRYEGQGWTSLECYPAARAVIKPGRLASDCVLTARKRSRMTYLRILRCSMVASILLGCAPHVPQADRATEPACQQWRLGVTNTTQFSVRIFVTGDGPEVLLGSLGPGQSRIWFLTTEPERVEVRDRLGGEAKGVEVRTVCVGSGADGGQ